MANMHWVIKLIFVGLIAGVDYSQGKADIGFIIAAYYLFASLYSLVRRDMLMFEKRFFMFALFVAEVMSVSSYIDSPPDLGILDRWVQKLAK